MKNKLLMAALTAATTLMSACVVSPTPIYREPVLVAPPPPRVEYPGYAPYDGYVWFGGYWAWTGYRHEWIPGRWDAPRPGYRWIAPRWERDGNRWRQHEGRWESDHSPRVVVQPAPSAPRYERFESQRSEPVPQPRQEQAPAPIPAPHHEVDGRQHEQRMAPPQQQPQTIPPGRDERDRERGDRRSGRRGPDDDRR